MLELSIKKGSLSNIGVEKTKTILKGSIISVEVGKIKKIEHLK